MKPRPSLKKPDADAFISGSVEEEAPTPEVKATPKPTQGANKAKKESLKASSVSITLPGVLFALIDKRVADMKQDDPWKMPNRSLYIKNLIIADLEARGYL
jgi:hypothetical protein